MKEAEAPIPDQQQQVIKPQQRMAEARCQTGASDGVGEAGTAPIRLSQPAQAPGRGCRPEEQEGKVLAMWVRTVRAGDGWKGRNKGERSGLRTGFKAEAF